MLLFAYRVLLYSYSFLLFVLFVTLYRFGFLFFTFLYARMPYLSQVTFVSGARMLTCRKRLLQVALVCFICRNYIALKFVRFNAGVWKTDHYGMSRRRYGIRFRNQPGHKSLVENANSEKNATLPKSITECDSVTLLQ